MQNLYQSVDIGACVEINSLHIIHSRLVVSKSKACDFKTEMDEALMVTLTWNNFNARLHKSKMFSPWQLLAEAPRIHMGHDLPWVDPVTVFKRIIQFPYYWAARFQLSFQIDYELNDAL